MILPKLISIDTSIFGDLTRDYFSQNRKRSEKAHKTIAHLIEEGLVPFLSFHHIQEILQHQDSDVVFERWSLIKKFPIVAWVCSFNDDNVLGSIFDVHQIEIKLILDNPSNGVDRLIEEIKSKYIKYISGDEYVNKFEPLYYEIRDMGMIDVQRGKEIESLSHIRSKEVDNCRLSDLFNSRLRRPDEVKEFMDRFETQLAESLESKGDRKLYSPQAVAKTFVQEVEKEGQELYSTDSSLYEAFVKNSGVRMDQVTPKTTVGRLGYLGIYNKKVRQILESLSISKEREVELSPDRHATWVIWEHLDMAMKYEKRAHGSNIQDKHMGIFSLFVDVFTVDRRVNEYFRQLSKKNPDLSACLGNIVKLSNYSELIAIR